MKVLSRANGKAPATGSFLSRSSLAGTVGAMGGTTSTVPDVKRRLAAAVRHARNGERMRQASGGPA